MMRYLFLFSLLISFNSQSQDWSELSPAIGNIEIRTFAKCYALFVREPLDYNHPKVSEIQNDQKTGIESCAELLNEVVLNRTTGELENADPEKMKILKTFNDLHRSWFPSLFLGTSEDLTDSALLQDPQEPAYFYTRSLFQDGKKGKRYPHRK